MGILHRPVSASHAKVFSRRSPYRVWVGFVVGLAARPAVRPARKPATPSCSPANYWQKLTLGAVTSILLHESAHIAVAFAVGPGPYFGFDKLRPTVYSGIDSHLEPH